MRLACPLHEDDWIHVVAHKDYPGRLFWCPECDALWFNQENLLRKEQTFGVTYTKPQSYGTLTGKEYFWLGAEDLGEYSPVDTINS